MVYCSRTALSSGENSDGVCEGACEGMGVVKRGGVEERVSEVVSVLTALSAVTAVQSVAK